MIPIEKKLTDAYAKLVKKQSGKVTVSLLCEKADVSRATFYIYYKDMNDFVEKLSNHIINKFFDQSTRLLSCTDREFETEIKKENWLFDEQELLILQYMISENKYMNFASRSASYYLKERSKSLFSQEVWQKHKNEIDLFSSGYLMLLILGMTGIMSGSFENDIKCCRKLFDQLCQHIQMSKNE